MAQLCHKLPTIIYGDLNMDLSKKTTKTEKFVTLQIKEILSSFTRSETKATFIRSINEIETTRGGQTTTE